MNCFLLSPSENSVLLACWPSQLPVGCMWGHNVSSSCMYTTATRDAVFYAAFYLVTQCFPKCRSRPPMGSPRLSVGMAEALPEIGELLIWHAFFNFGVFFFWPWVK